MSSVIVPAEATAPSPSRHMIPLSSDYVLSRSLQVVAELGIADLLDDSRRPALDRGDGPTGASQPSPGWLTDLIMLVSHRGQERTEEEYRELLATAGFRLTRVMPTASPVSVIEAVPAERDTCERRDDPC